MVYTCLLHGSVPNLLYIECINEIPLHETNAGGVKTQRTVSNAAAESLIIMLSFTTMKASNQVRHEAMGLSSHSLPVMKCHAFSLAGC